MDNYELLACHALIVFPYSLTDSIFLLPFGCLVFYCYLFNEVLYMILLLDVILNDKDTLETTTRAIQEH